MKFRVVGEWLVEAESQEQAENFVENAVAQDGSFESELEDCNAEEEE